MERATQKDERGYYLVGDGIYSDEGTPEKFRGDDVDRLAAYEDTGFEPEEIGALKSREKGLVELLSGVSCGCAVTYTRLRKLAQADREGRCVVLPCKIGDTLYEIIRYRNSGIAEIVERTVLSVEKFQDGGYIKMQRWVPCHDTGDILKQRVDSWAKIEDFGKVVFLTRKDAEAALRREQDG